MKKLVLALFAISVIVACKQEENTDTNVHISGNIKGLSQGKLFLQKLQDSTLITIDSININ